MNTARIAFAFAILAATAALAPAQPTAKPMLDTRWAELASPDDGKATRALLALAATPKEATAFLQEQLKPVKADAKRVAQLIKALDSDTFAIRSQASTELEYFGKYIKTDLEAALKAHEKTETKMRLQQLLDKLPKDKKADPPMPMPKVGGRNVSISTVNGNVRVVIDGQVFDLNNLTPPAPPPPPPGPPTGWIRAVRAVNLLEHLGTPEAQSLLQTIAAGEADALPTIAAREALERLKK